MLPEPFDGVEVRAVGGQELRLDVVPVERFRFVPARVVEDQHDALAPLCRNLVCHGVEEGLEDLRVVVRDDEADELAAAGVDRADDVLPDVAAVVGLGRARAALHPALAGARIALEAGLVAEEGFNAGVFEEADELGGEVLALRDPQIPVGRLGHGARDVPGVVLFVKVADEGWVGEIQVEVPAQPSAEFDRRPVALTGEGRVVDDGQDCLADRFRCQYPRASAARAVGDPVHAH